MTVATSHGTTHARAIAALATVIVIGGAVLARQEAQRPQPPPPNPLGQPLLDGSGNPRESAMLRAPLLAEDRQYADIDGMKMKAIVNELAAISQKDRASGTVFWGRNVGTPAHDATQAWVEGYYRKHNLTVSRKSFELRPQWTPKSWEVSFTSGGRALPLKTARPATGSQSTPPGGLELDLVWVGLGIEADFRGRDVAGKAVLSQDIPTPGVLNHSVVRDRAIQRAFEKGAAAVGTVYGIADNLSLWELRTEGRPGFNVGYEDGKILQEMLGKGETVKVKLRMDSEMRSGLKTASVWGVLPGTTDEDIIIIAHIDGYFDGAIDNGSGVAVMMGLLEHYAKVPASQRRRTIRFLASAGHHGGPGARFLHDERDTELARTALMINLEHVAAVRTKNWGPRLRKTTAVSPMRWWVNGSPRLLDITLKAFSRFNVGIMADMDPGASGEMGAVARDAPSIQVITSPEVKHAENDTAEWVPAAGLEQIGRAYAKIIDELNKLDRKDILPATAGTSSQ